MSVNYKVWVKWSIIGVAAGFSADVATALTKRFFAKG
jgi:hypothetical protein